MGRDGAEGLTAGVHGGKRMLEGTSWMSETEYRGVINLSGLEGAILHMVITFLAPQGRWLAPAANLLGVWSRVSLWNRPVGIHK
jgi:hypothetical protein